MPTPIQQHHEYDLHHDNGSVTTVKTHKDHNHSDFGGDIIKWYHEHKTLVNTAAKIILIRKGNITLWKKPQ